MNIETIRFRNDTATRKRLMVSESFQHPAKGHLGLWSELIQMYSQPGDLVLDPMAGSGATLLAALMGRNVICVELEQHFVDPMRRSWEKMRTMPMLGCEMGQVVILRGDARCLSSVLGLETPMLEQNPDLAADLVVSSPPYEGSIQGAHDGIDWSRQADGRKKQEPHGVGAHPWSYSRPTYEKVKAKVEHGEYTGIRPDVWISPTNMAAQGYLDGYSGSSENIGNLRGQAYWESMRQVYAECWRVLRPGGIMALVLKGFTRDGQYVDLPGQTEALLLEAGWVKHDHWRRELWSLSFWRILQKRRDPAAWDDRLMYESVLAFRKSEGQGNGIDTVITSPPYEGSLQGDEPSGKLFETERRVNSPASGNRKSLRKPLGQGYTRKEQT